MNNIGNDKLLVSTTRFTVRPENRKEFFQTITPLIRKIRNENGCLNYSLFEEAGDENSLLIIGEWKTRMNWDSHRESDNHAVFQGLINLLSIRSKMDFKLLSKVGGIELMVLTNNLGLLCVIASAG